MSKTTEPYLTVRQLRALKLVTDPKRQRIMPPTLEEVKDELGLPSRQAAHNLITTLVKKGFLKKTSRGNYEQIRAA